MTHIGHPGAIVRFVMDWHQEKVAVHILEKYHSARANNHEVGMHRFILLRNTRPAQGQEYISLHIACESDLLQEFHYP
jgi:hypothetical protein